MRAADAEASPPVRICVVYHGEWHCIQPSSSTESGTWTGRYSSGAYLERQSWILPSCSYRVSPAFSAALRQPEISAVRKVESPCKRRARDELPMLEVRRLLQNHDREAPSLSRSMGR